MARLQYGFSGDAVLLNDEGQPLVGQPVQVYRTETGTTADAALLNASGSAVTVVTSDTIGALKWYGADGYKGSYWVAIPGYAGRLKVDPTDVPERLAAVEVLAGSAAADAAAKADAAQLSATSDAKSYSDNLMLSHTEANDPHPFYLQVRDAVTGQLKNIQLWHGSAFPTAALGAADDDILIYTGN